MNAFQQSILALGDHRDAELTQRKRLEEDAYRRESHLVPTQECGCGSKSPTYSNECHRESDVIQIHCDHNLDVNFARGLPVSGGPPSIGLEGERFGIVV